MEWMLNRMRGSGGFAFGIPYLSGSKLYAIYIAVLIGMLSYFRLYGVIEYDFNVNLYWYVETIHIYLDEENTAILHGVIAGLLFTLGESMGWGKWIGYLVSFDGKQKPNYKDKEGVKFPFIHQTANYFAPEIVDYREYCKIALTIRGLYWWLPLFSFLLFIGLIGWFEALSALAILSVGFPIACEIGANMRYEYHSKYFNTSRGWENQEIVYGIMQTICITINLLIY